STGGNVRSALRLSKRFIDVSHLSCITCAISHRDVRSSSPVILSEGTPRYGFIASHLQRRGSLVPPALAPTNPDTVAAPPSLAGLAAVAARLAVREPETDQLVSVVEAAKGAIGADECVLWSFTPGGLERLAASLHSGARADEVSALLAGGELERNGLIVRPL